MPSYFSTSLPSILRGCCNPHNHSNMICHDPLWLIWSFSRHVSNFCSVISCTLEEKDYVLTEGEVWFPRLNLDYWIMCSNGGQQCFFNRTYKSWQTIKKVVVYYSYFSRWKRWIVIHIQHSIKLKEANRGKLHLRNICRNRTTICFKSKWNSRANLKLDRVCFTRQGGCDWWSDVRSFRVSRALLWNEWKDFNILPQLDLWPTGRAFHVKQKCGMEIIAETTWERRIDWKHDSVVSCRPALIATTDDSKTVYDSPSYFPVVIFAKSG